METRRAGLEGGRAELREGDSKGEAGDAGRCDVPTATRGGGEAEGRSQAAGRGFGPGVRAAVRSELLDPPSTQSTAHCSDLRAVCRRRQSVAEGGSEDELLESGSEADGGAIAREAGEGGELQRNARMGLQMYLDREP